MTEQRDSNTLTAINRDRLGVLPLKRTELNSETGENEIYAKVQ